MIDYPDQISRFAPSSTFVGSAPTDAIRHHFPSTFGLVLVAALGLRFRLSGNECFSYSTASTGFASLPEKSGAPSYTPIMRGYVKREGSESVRFTRLVPHPTRGTTFNILQSCYSSIPLVNNFANSSTSWLDGNS